MAVTKRIHLRVEGMHCANCEQQVTSALEGVEGVQAVDVPSWQGGRAEVLADEGASREALLAALQGAGYEAELAAKPPTAPAAQRGPQATTYMDKDFNLMVVGAGSAGFAAAIKGADLGFRVGLVGDGALGGTCVNVGCVPSKTLIRAAEAWHRAAHHPFQGVETGKQRLDWQVIRRQKDELVTDMRRDKYSDLLAAYPSITHIPGRARFTPEGLLQVGDELYSAGKYVVVTGAQPRMLSFPGWEEAAPLNSTTLMDLDKLPESLIILGGRAVALELGQAMARFGVRVVILQRSARLVPDHEPEIGRAIKDYFEQEGIAVVTGVEIERLARDGEERVIKARVNGREREFRADQILMALGRQPNTADLGLENVGVELDANGAILVDEYQQSSNGSIFAAGDVTQNPELVYVAAAGGVRAAENALTEEKKRLNLNVVPTVIFSDPQIATVGLTEAEAAQQGLQVETSLLHLEHVARARAARDVRGFIKLVAEKDGGRLLGAHILAAEGGEVVQSATLAIQFGLTLADLRDTLFPYLTQVEGLKLATLAFYKDPAMLSCCAM